MRLYADVPGSMDARELLDGIEVALDRSRDPGTATAGRIEAAREALIATGILEQGIADAHGAADGGDKRRSGTAALTDHAATILDRLSSGGAEEATPSRALARARDALRSCGPLATVHPEGYLFYALFPDLYIGLGAAIGSSLGDRSAVVIGVRSIGTSLGAAVAAGLRARGTAVQRHTVRPAGDPFARVTVPSPRQRDEWRGAVMRGASFIVVDEGPGLSGSSLASVVAALGSLGVPADRLHIACAAHPASLPMASAAVRAIWDRTRIWPAENIAPGFWGRTLPSWLATVAGVLPEGPADLSWGAWSGHLSDGVAPSMPQFERRKLLLAKGSRRVLAKFVGFGALGRHKATHLSRLAEAGLVPEYTGCAHGMVLQEWEGGPQPGDRGDDALLDAAATYYAFLRRTFRVQDGIDTSTLAETVEAIAGDWFGSTPPGDVRRMLGGIRDASAMEGDQRPERVEWRQAGGRLLKTDAADHYLDHTWARRMDVAFDLAGFAIEFELEARREGELLRRYVAASGDTSIGTRLPFFRTVYAAHRLATADTAYHATSGNRSTLDLRRRQMAAGLAAALQAGDASACA